MISSSPLPSVLLDICEKCNDCGICVNSCTLLSQYGTTRTISTLFDFYAPQQRQVAYGCSLCGLCTAVCSKRIDPCSLFMEIRHYHVESGCWHNDEARTFPWLPVTSALSWPACYRDNQQYLKFLWSLPALPFLIAVIALFLVMLTER